MEKNLILIAATDSKGGIGKDGKLLLNNKEDMKMFKELTMWHPVIMGRKTWESIGCKPLANRINIVISSADSIPLCIPQRETSIPLPLRQEEGLILVDSIEKAIAIGTSFRKAFVIGGGSIYEQTIQMCEEAYITENNGDYEADTFLPDIWTLGKKLNKKASLISQQALNATSVLKHYHCFE